MRRFLWLPLVFLASLSLFAQTDAQRALMNEPEIRQINAMTHELQRTQADPELRGSPLNMAGLTLADLRTAQALLDRLEDRLNTEARACAFCAAKQDELSELIRERVAVQHMTASILGPSSGSVQQLAGVTPTVSRWSDMRIALKDGSSAISAYCPPLNNQNDACKGEDAAMRLAGGHENAWAKCFNAHNWVERSSERKAYESCLADTDPILKLCAAARKASPQAPACPTFTVNYADVDQVHYYHDRFSTDPNQLPATAIVVPNQPAHFTTLEALVTPAMPTNAGFQTKVRARLDTPIDGQYSAALSPSTANVAALDAKAGAGLSGRVMLIPAGTEFDIQVTFAGAAGQHDSGNLELQIANTRGPNMLITPGVMSRIPWPQPGAVLLAANSPVSFVTQCGCPYQMSVAEFRTRAADYAAAKASSPAKKYRTIVMGTRIPVVLLEPIDNAGVLAGKRFHGQLSADSELLQGFKRDDAFTIPKGTDVYLKVTDVNDKPVNAQYASLLRIDYLMLNGQKIALKTVGDNLSAPVRFAPPAPSGRRGAPTSNVLDAAGARKLFTVAEQTEVNTEGMAIPEAVATPAPTTTPAPPPQGPAGAGKGRATAPTEPPPSAAPPGARGPAAGDVRNVADYSSSWLGRSVSATGTVARVESSGPWELVYFKESPDFVACFVASVFRGPSSQAGQAGGADFTGLVGKTVQMQGPVLQNQCAGKPGLRIITPAQLQVER